MSSQLKLRRGSTVSHAGFTGADGEVTFNTNTNALVTHDGVTAGGFPHVKASDLNASSGAALVGYLPKGNSASSTTVNLKLRESISAEDFGVDPTNETTDQHLALQKAVDYCLAYGKDLLITSKIKLTTPIIINRQVDTTTDLFTIYGNGANSGFWSDVAIAMFSSTLSYGGNPDMGNGSEGIKFKNIRFFSTDNTLSLFAIDLKKFLRMRFNECYFDGVKLGESNASIQTYFISNCTILNLHGVWMKGYSGGNAPLAGYIFDVHLTDNVIESSDMIFSTLIHITGIATGCSLHGNLFESIKGPVLFSGGGCTGVSIAGNYHEGIHSSCYQLGTSYSVVFSGNFFDCDYGISYYAIDCQTSRTVSGIGNYSNGNLYKSSLMLNTEVTDGNGFYHTASKGLLSVGDVVYNANRTLTDDTKHTTWFKALRGSTVHHGVNDFTVGNIAQKVAVFHADGVSGSIPPSGFNAYTTTGIGGKTAVKLTFKAFDDGAGESVTPSFSMTETGVQAKAVNSLSGQISLPSATAVEILNLTNYGAGRYEIFAYLDGSVAENYAAYATVIYTGNGGAAKLIAVNGVAMAITLSGLHSINLTQSSGVTQVGTYRVLNIS